MSAQPRGLGRGLNALIPVPGAPAATSEPGTEQAGAKGVLEVPVDEIAPNPWQPRTRIDQESLAELAASIKEHGLIQPLIVTRARPTARTPYQLIAGERRWRAAQLLGLATVPVLVKEASPQQSLELALVENIQRADLNPLEEAEAYQALIDGFHLNQQEVADRVGKSRVAVANTVRLLRLPEQVKAMLGDGTLSEGHARCLLALPGAEEIVRTAERIVARALSVRQAEELVRQRLAAHQVTPKQEEPEQDDDPDAQHTRYLEEAFRTVLGTKVALSRGRRGGKLVISFYSDEELQSIFERIVGSE